MSPFKQQTINHPSGGSLNAVTSDPFPPFKGGGLMNQADQKQLTPFTGGGPIGQADQEPLTQAGGGENMNHVDKKATRPKPSKVGRQTGPRKKSADEIEETFRRFKAMRRQRITLQEIGKALHPLKEGQLIDFLDREQKIQDAKSDKKATRPASELPQLFRDIFDLEDGGQFEFVIDITDIDAKKGNFTIIGKADSSEKSNQS